MMYSVYDMLSDKLLHATRYISSLQINSILSLKPVYSLYEIIAHYFEFLHTRLVRNSSFENLSLSLACR